MAKKHEYHLRLVLSSAKFFGNQNKSESMPMSFDRHSAHAILYMTHFKSHFTAFITLQTDRTDIIYASFK